MALSKAVKARIRRNKNSRSRRYLEAKVLRPIEIDKSWFGKFNDVVGIQKSPQ